jgi:hypothetical protein
MPDYGRIDDRSEFRAFIASTAKEMKKGGSEAGRKKIESAFEALAKGSELKIGTNKSIQGSELGKKEVKALYKLTKKFIEKHESVTVSDSLLANMNIVGGDHGLFLAARFEKLENRIVEKADIEYSAGVDDLKKALNGELKQNAQKLNDLKKKYHTKLAKHLAIGAGVGAGALVGLGLALATGGIAFFIGLGLLALGMVGGFFTISKSASVAKKEFDYREATILQNGRIKALELLNDEEKLKSFCKWHDVTPEKVTVNELMYAYRITGQLVNAPKVSKEFRELNRAYHARSDRFVEKFQGCGLEDDVRNLQVVHYLGLTMRYPYPPMEQKYWIFRRLLDLQKGLQPDSGQESVNEEYQRLLNTDPRNAWQEFRMETLGQFKTAEDAYHAGIARYGNSDEFTAQRKNDADKLDVTSDAYKEYAFLLKVDQNPDAGGYHSARLEELREKLSRGGDYA